MIVTRFLYRSHNVTQCLSVTGAHVSGHWSPLVTTHLYPEVIIFSKIFQLTMNNWKQIFGENFNEDNIEKIAEHWVENIIVSCGVGQFEDDWGLTINHIHICHLSHGSHVLWCEQQDSVRQFVWSTLSDQTHKTVLYQWPEIYDLQS